MKTVIVTKEAIDSEFDYQALDYYRLLNNTYLTAQSEAIRNFLGEYKVESLNHLTKATVLLFDSVEPKHLQSMGEHNRVVKFMEDGSIDYHTIRMINMIDCFVCFGSRSAYRLAYNLRNMKVSKPVYKILPWTDTTGIKKYDDAPFGKLSATKDVDIRGMFRLMSAGAIVIAPDVSPFNDVIVDGWNGLIYRDYTGPSAVDYSLLDNNKIREISRTLKNSDEVAERSIEFAERVLDKERYINAFDGVINGESFDHNEPWIDPITIKRTSWIIPKEDGEAGVIYRIPNTYQASFKEMRVSPLDRLLNYLINMPFDSVYVFDVMAEELDDDKIGNINRMISILGDKIKDVHFCFNPPPEWAMIPQLSYLSVEEGVKQVS